MVDPAPPPAAAQAAPPATAAAPRATSKFSDGMNFGFGLVVAAILCVAVVAASFVIVAFFTDVGDSIRSTRYRSNEAPRTQSPPSDWRNNGRSSLCDGVPKNTVFQCKSPYSGKIVSCTCD